MSLDSPRPARSLWLNSALAATTLLSAWLLFQVQPMVAKRILPWFGGGSAVWTTAMLFFQTALFAGYLYAHLLVQRLAARRQVLVHLALLAVAAASALAVGVIPADAWKPTHSGQPSLHILAMLAASVGLPYLMLSATAPLVQVWFSRANPGRSPYRLYALSNAGSLAALLSYPFLVEPHLGVARQAAGWSLLFAAFAILCGTSGLLALLRVPLAPPVIPAVAVVPDQALADFGELSRVEPVAHVNDDRPLWLQYVFWLALPACASVLLLAVTAHLCQDVAPIPLLWILPMVVYLLTFILAFDSERWYRRAVWMPLGAALSFAAVWNWHAYATASIHWRLGVHLALLLALGMVCHGELARMRPPTSRLTSYYLCLSAGGALGGLLAGIVAPLVLTDHYELHFSILAAWVLAMTAMVADRRSPFHDGRNFKGLLGMAALLVALALAMDSHASGERGNSLALARNFYGVLKVREISAGSDDSYYHLTNGDISHGSQFRSVNNRRVPLSYYHPATGVGQIMTALDEQTPQRVGLVGLGVGTLAAYAEAGDEFQFFEINPQVIEFADKYFTYLQDARERGAKITTVEGDGRLSLERAPSKHYDVLVLDAFNSDAVPAHLLTLEAFELYLDRLKPDGILAVHITNEHLNLAEVVQAAADRFDLDAAVEQRVADGSPGDATTQWALLYRRRGYFAERDLGGPLSQLATESPVLWTDDYSNLLGILKD